MLQCSMNLARQPFENLEAAFERTYFAVRQLSDAAFERRVAGRRAAERLLPRLGEPERETAAVVGVGLAVDQSGPDQHVDRAADGGRAALHPGGDLIEGGRF